MKTEQAELPASAYFEGYIRKLFESGEEVWTLFDCDGVPVCKSNNRSVPFFFAVQHDIVVRLLN